MESGSSGNPLPRGHDQWGRKEDLQRWAAERPPWHSVRPAARPSAFNERHTVMTLKWLATNPSTATCRYWTEIHHWSPQHRLSDDPRVSDWAGPVCERLQQSEKSVPLALTALSRLTRPPSSSQSPSFHFPQQLLQTPMFAQPPAAPPPPPAHFNSPHTPRTPASVQHIQEHLSLLQVEIIEFDENKLSVWHDSAIVRWNRAETLLLFICRRSCSGWWHQGRTLNQGEDPGPQPSPSTAGSMSQPATELHCPSLSRSGNHRGTGTTSTLKLWIFTDSNHNFLQVLPKPKQQEPSMPHPCLPEASCSKCSKLESSQLDHNQTYGCARHVFGAAHNAEIKPDGSSHATLWDDSLEIN